MEDPMGTDDSLTLEISGFGGLNLLDFIKADIPENCWPARIRIHDVGENGLVAAKLHYVDIDGTNAEAVRAYLQDNKELSVKEADCEIDIMKLLAAAGQLDVTLPNTARLAAMHPLSIDT
jgi:hypothetical protein